MTNTFDCGIIGAGVAGAFATYKMAKDHKDVKTVVFDLGRPPMKRRRQLEGWLGVLPNSDGKLYTTDCNKVSNLVGVKKAKAGVKWVTNIIDNVMTLKVIKDKSPSIMAVKKLKKFNYELQLNNYMQMYPKDIHALSKFMTEDIENSKNITFCFDNEVIKISKQKNMFIIQTDEEEYKCKKIIICVGRSGWRWACDLYSNFGIIDDNNIAKFGVRIEMPCNNLKDFNKSNCTLTKNDGPRVIEIGPLSWNGTVIPEDHVDLAISSFRSNENRWKSDKVSFNFIGNIFDENFGYQQTDRIGKLTFVLSNDRIIKERVSTILNDKSKISIIPQYDWIKEDIIKLGDIMPDVLTKAYFHVPTIIPLPPKINIGTNLESEIDGMFVAGESAGVSGLLSAASMGMIATEAACK